MFDEYWYIFSKIINKFKIFISKNTDESRTMEYKSINFCEDYIFDNDKIIRY